MPRDHRYRARAAVFLNLAPPFGTPNLTPVNLVLPAITPAGGPAGTTFGFVAGSWTNASSFTRRWLLGGTSIGTGTTVVSAAGSLALEVTATGPTGLTTVVTTPAVTVTAAVAALAITGTPAASAIVGAAYSFTPTVTGGQGTKTFALTGTLPGGLAFNTATGAITGTLTTAGNFTGLNITVTDTSGSASLGVFSVAVSAAVGTPTIAFANLTANVAEGNAGTSIVSNTINLTRNNVTGPIVVNLTYGGTATSGTDYVAGPVSATIPAGQNSVSFDLTINGDTVVEPDETIVINAALADYPTSTATKTITIVNDDAAATFAIPANTNVAGDSQTGGVGAPTGYDWPAQLKALETTNSGNIVDFTGLTAGGATTANITSAYSSITAARRAGNFIFAHGLSDMIYVQSYADGPATIKAGIASMIGNSDFVGGGGWWYYAVQPSPDGQTKGQPAGADIRWNVRDMQATYGEDHTVWMERDMVEMGDPTPGGADAQTIAAGSSIPNHFRAPNLGNPHYPFAENNAPIVDVATLADANSGTGIGTDGQNIWLTDIKRWAIRSDAAKAAGLNYYAAGSDTRHRSRWGYAADAAVHKAVLQGLTNVAPYASATERKVPQDIAANATVATVKFVGSATSVAFTAGNGGGQFSVALSGQTFVIKRTGTGTLAESFLPMTLRVQLTNAAGRSHTSIVDVFVGQPSTQVLPRMYSVAAPGIALSGKKVTGLTDGKILSGVIWLAANTANINTIYLSTITGTSSITITSGGGIQFTFQNATGTQILFWRTAGGFIPNNTACWLAFKFNLATGVVQVVVNKAGADVAGAVAGTPVITNDTVVFNNKPLSFFNGGVPSGRYTGLNPLTGKFGLLWLSSDDLDCSVAANLRQFWNLDGTPVARAFKSTTAGCATGIEVQGGPGDLAWGSVNAADPNIVLPTINAPTVMALA